MQACHIESTESKRHRVNLERSKRKKHLTQRGVRIRLLFFQKNAKRGE